jgi:hypothetical protein
LGIEGVVVDIPETAVIGVYGSDIGVLEHAVFHGYICGVETGNGRYPVEVIVIPGCSSEIAVGDHDMACDVPYVYTGILVQTVDGPTIDDKGI